MADYRYDPKQIEPRWQRVWADERTWEVANPDPTATGRGGELPKSYVLVMLPYPSGEPHIGHLKVYSVGDAVAHFHRRTGRRVLHPMGYDAFGLPAEQFAVQTGQHPRVTTEANIAAIDTAIEQSRRALATDPANVYLHSHLAEARQRKLALLRRGVDLVNGKS